MKINHYCKTIATTFFTLLISLSISGCADMNLGQGKKTAESAVTKTRQTTAVYYDFDDVLCPKELQVIDDSTFVVSTPGYTSGIITLKGRVDKRSLVNFFTNNMAKDNWSMLSNIKSPGATIMIFQKASRWAVITIREKDFNTYVEVGVAPTLENDKNMSAQETDLFN
ncbi:MAG: hypothetical protein GY737_11650 [Desulfobacteraceae bacterium]|nr:hypothetical protein [Desulfobacteraceae bacterium]